MLERWRAWRDRLLASPGFLRWAIAFPLTRPIARTRARALFDLCAGFVYSQTLFACVKLGLFEELAKGPADTDDLARRLSLSPETMIRLLNSAESLKLLERRGDKFGLGPLGAAVLANPGVAAMVEHHAMLYEDLKDPVSLLQNPTRETALRRYWAYAAAERPDASQGKDVSAYSRLMSASQMLVAETVLNAHSLRPYRQLMDVGGGDGTFLSAAGNRWPHLSLTLFDLPAVAERARTRLKDEGLANRAQTQGGDFLRDALPKGADLISLVRVIHDHDDAPAQNLLTKAREALPPQGALLLAEPMARTPGAEPVGGAYFEFYLLAMGSGRPRSREELEAMLRRAGFTRIRHIRTKMPLIVEIILALP